MDSEIEPSRKPRLIRQEPRAAVVVDDEVEKETISTDLLVAGTQKLDEVPLNNSGGGGKKIDEVIKKISKRVSRHRNDIDDLLDSVEKIDKRSRNIRIDQEFIDKIGMKLGEKFASKKEVVELTKVVNVLSTDIDELIKSLKKSNDELSALVKQSKSVNVKETVKEDAVEQDVADSDDEGETVANGFRYINHSDEEPDESDKDIVKTDELEEIMVKDRPAQSIVDEFSETEDINPPKKIEVVDQTYNFIYSI